MKEETKHLRAVTTIEFGICLHPIRWLESVGSAVMCLVTLPFRILGLLGHSCRVTGTVLSAGDMGFFGKLIVSVATALTVLLIMIPKMILHAVVKAALVCILVELNVNKVLIPLDSQGEKLKELIDGGADGVEVAQAMIDAESSDDKKPDDKDKGTLTC